MYPLELEKIKAFLRVEHDDDDDVIQGVWESAVDAVEARLRRDIMGERAPLANDVDDVPAGVRTTCLMVTSFLYENRDNPQDVMPMVVSNALLSRYIRWGG